MPITLLELNKVLLIARSGFESREVGHGNGFSEKRRPPQLRDTQASQRQGGPAGEPTIGASDASSTPPRNGRFVHRNAFALLDCESLVALLRFAGASRNVKSISSALIIRFGSLGAVFAASRSELLAVPNMTPKILALVTVVRDTALRAAEYSARSVPIDQEWEQLIKYLTILLARATKEQCWVLFLDTQRYMIADESLSRGTVNYVAVHIREILERAIELKASAVVLVHNHPSGLPDPSSDDFHLTKQAADALRHVGIELHDSIIVASSGYLSFRQNGYMKNIHTFKTGHEYCADCELTVDMPTILRAIVPKT